MLTQKIRYVLVTLLIWVNVPLHYHNREIPSRKCSIKAPVEPLFMSWLRFSFSEVNDWALITAKPSKIPNFAIDLNNKYSYCYYTTTKCNNSEKVTPKKRAQQKISSVTSRKFFFSEDVVEIHHHIILDNFLVYTTLFRYKRFALNKMFQQNASKFAIFYV